MFTFYCMSQLQLNYTLGILKLEHVCHRIGLMLQNSCHMTKCCAQVRALSNSFAEKDGAPLSWRIDQRYSGLNIGVLGIFFEPLQR